MMATRRKTLVTIEVRTTTAQTCEESRATLRVTHNQQDCQRQRADRTVSCTKATRFATNSFHRAGSS